MQLKSIILGIAATAILMGVLLLTRLMVLDTEITDIEFRELEVITIPEVLDAELEDVEVEDQVPPPPPQQFLPDLSVSHDVSQVALPSLDVAVNPRLSIESFSTDQAPAPLPVAVVKKPVKTKPSKRPTASVKKPAKVKISKPVIKKSVYSASELDSSLRHLRSPSVKFPRSIKGASSGRVVVKISISSTGKTSLISVLSSSHPALVPIAKKIANGSRFTVPTYKGRPVKVIKSWPIVIKK